MTKRKILIPQTQAEWAKSITPTMIHYAGADPIFFDLADGQRWHVYNTSRPFPARVMFQHAGAFGSHGWFYGLIPTQPPTPTPDETLNKIERQQYDYWLSESAAMHAGRLVFVPMAEIKAAVLAHLRATGDVQEDETPDWLDDPRDEGMVIRSFMASCAWGNPDEVTE